MDPTARERSATRAVCTTPNWSERNKSTPRIYAQGRRLKEASPRDAGFSIARDNPDTHWAKEASGPYWQRRIMRHQRTMYAPTSFAVAVSETKKRRRKLQTLPVNQRRPRSLPRPEASRRKRKRLESHFANWGVGLGGKRLYHLTLSHFIPKYIRSDTKDTQQDPTSTFYFPRLHRGGGFVNTSTKSVSSGNRTDCREVYFFFCSPGG